MRQAKTPFHLITKPIGAQCNLRCEYCFYLEKTDLYPGQRAAAFRMSEAMLERMIKSLVQARAPQQNELEFTWQGGEPTMMGVGFFRKAVELQKKYVPPGIAVFNSFQTNATLIDDEFAAFLAEHKFLVGVSVDGPQVLHDRYRYDIAGRGSFAAVMKGLETLKKHRVEYNILTVVQNDNAEHPEAVYDFLKTLGTPFLQFIPIVEPAAESGASPQSVSGKQWGEFMTRIFHRWREKDMGDVFVQLFDMTLGITVGYPASLCVHARTCGRAVALEHNGDVYSCDHFVDKKHFLGNITQKPLAELVDGKFQRQFGEDKFAALPKQCRACPELRFCHGGCPEDRLIPAEGGKLNWLCEGYQRFFRETAPYFSAMAQALRHGRLAADYPRFMPGAPGK